MNRQTVIPLDERGTFSLDNFAGNANKVLVAEMKELASGIRLSRIMYVWGKPGTGKTHLLNASCSENRRLGGVSFYLSLEVADSQDKIAAMTDPDALVCIDNLHSIDLGGGLQESLFHVCQNLHAGQGRLLVCGSCPLGEINLSLKDLESRLSSGGMFQIRPLSDEEKKEALQSRAKQRGIALQNSVLNYILINYSRQTQDLFDLLDCIGSESLRHQRRITVPFVRELIGR